MTADPIESFVGGEPAAQVAYVTDWLPAWWELPGDQPHAHAGSSFRLVNAAPYVPGEWNGYNLSVSPVIVDVPVSQDSSLGQFRAEVFTGLSTYQYNGRPGTPFTDPYVGWMGGGNSYRREYYNLGWLDGMDQMNQVYTGTPTYYTASWTNPEVSSFRGVGDEPEMVLDGEFTTMTHNPWNNPLLNPALAAGGGASERPDDGLLYPRKV